MKLLLTTLAVALFGSMAFSAEYSVFRVCEEQRVIRTADGTDAGHVEYIVVEPSSHRVVTAIATGGALGDRLVAVPAQSLSFAGEREILLTGITRERLVSAPVVERTQISTSAGLQRTVIERSQTHFDRRSDVNASANERSSDAIGTSTNVIGSNAATATSSPSSSTPSTDPAATTSDRDRRALRSNNTSGPDRPSARPTEQTQSLTEPARQRAEAEARARAEKATEGAQRSGSSRPE